MNARSADTSKKEKKFLTESLHAFGWRTVVPCVSRVCPGSPRGLLTGSKTPGGAGTHRTHTGHADARRHTDRTDEPHNHRNPPTTHNPHVSATTEAAADSQEPQARSRPPSYRYCTGTVVCVVRVPLCASACPVRVSRPCVPAPPGVFIPVLYRVCVPGSPLCLTGYRYGTVQYTFY